MIEVLLETSSGSSYVLQTWSSPSYIFKSHIALTDPGTRGRVRPRERADDLHAAERQQHAGQAWHEVHHQPRRLQRKHRSPLREALSQPGYCQVPPQVGGLKVLIDLEDIMLLLGTGLESIEIHKGA